MGERRRLVTTIVAVLVVAILIGAAIAGAVTSTVTTEEPQPSVTMVTDPVEQQKIIDSSYQPSEEINSAIQAQDFDKAIALLNTDSANYATDESKSENIRQLIEILEAQKEESLSNSQATPEGTLDPANLPSTGK